MAEAAIQDPHHHRDALALWWSSALLLAMAAVLTWGAWRAFPVWDDALVIALVKEHGPDRLRAAIGDRPVFAWILVQLARRGALVSTSAVFHLLTWWGTGIAAMLLWRRSFPSRRPFGVIAGLLAMAPVVVETQLVLVNVTFSGHLPALLPYLSMLVVVSRWGTRHRRVAILIAAALVGFACLLSEYGVLATFAAGAVFLWRDERAGDRRALVVLVGVALVAYAMYHRLASGAARLEVRPEHELREHGLRHLFDLPFWVPGTVLSGALGELLADFRLVFLSKRTLAGVGFGALVAAATVALCRRGHRDVGTAARPVGEDQRLVVLALTLVGGVAALLMLRAPPLPNVGTRFWLPLLPVVTCVTTYVVSVVARGHAKALVVAACGFLAGYLSLCTATQGRIVSAQFQAISAEVAREVAGDGFTVVVFRSTPQNDFVRQSGMVSDFELTERLVSSWEPRQRQRVYATTEDGLRRLQPDPHPHSLCGVLVPRHLVYDVRGWRREGEVASVVWVTMDDQAPPRIDVQRVR